MGTKRKITIEKRETESQIFVTCSKRRVGLYSKAADLCVLAGARIAVLVSRPSSDSSFYSFGHPSADAVVDAFLENRVPEALDEETKSSISLAYWLTKETKRERQRQYVDRVERNKESKKPKLGFWWEGDFEHCRSDELRGVIDRLEKLKLNVAARLNDGSSSDRHGNEVKKINGSSHLGAGSSHLGSGSSHLGSNPQSLCAVDNVNLTEPCLDLIHPNEYFRLEDLGISLEYLGGSEVSLDNHGLNIKFINDSSDMASDPQNIYDNDTVNATEACWDLVNLDEYFLTEDFGISLEDRGHCQPDSFTAVYCHPDSIVELQTSDPWQGLTVFNS